MGLITFFTDTNINDFTFPFDVIPDAICEYITSISPQSASPVLVKELVITFDANFDTTTMATDTWDVKLIPKHDTDDLLSDYCGEDTRNGTRPLNVIGHSTVDKSITVKYGGAYSGEYYVCVSAPERGNIESIGILFEAKA